MTGKVCLGSWLSVEEAALGASPAAVGLLAVQISSLTIGRGIFSFWVSRKKDSARI